MFDLFGGVWFGLICMGYIKLYIDKEFVFYVGVVKLMESFVWEFELF